MSKAVAWKYLLSESGQDIRFRSYWVKCSLSFSNGNCVEVANLSGGEIGVRNSRDVQGAVLRFTPDEWHAFLGGVRNGEFDSFLRRWQRQIIVAS
jgi:hypothetical protein